MLVEIAIADAYGAAFEHSSEGFVASRNKVEKYVWPQCMTQQIKPGRYTDDTQMTLAIAEMLVENKPWTRENLAESILATFKRDKRGGYPCYFECFLRATTDAAAFLKHAASPRNKTSGANRACPIGVLPNTHDVIYRASMQASLTDVSTEETIAAAGAALLSHFAVYRIDSPSRSHSYLHHHFPGHYIVPWKGKVRTGPECVSAALTAFQRNDRLSSLLKDCIAFTGNVDDVAVIAMAAASSSPFFENDLPNVFYDQLERSPYGAEYLESIDACLMKMAAC